MEVKRGLILVLLLALCWSFLPSTTEFATTLIPHVNGAFLQNSASLFVWFTTSVLFGIWKKFGSFTECFNEPMNETLITLVSVQKGGTAFSAFAGWEVARECGASMAMFSAENDHWPPTPLVPPTHAADILIAFAHSQRWPEYLDLEFNRRKTLKCVVLTRNPIDRFFSLYKYSRDGGESGLWAFSKKMARFGSVSDRVDYVWKAFGKESMSRTHKVLVDSIELNSTLGKCNHIRVDDFFKGGDDFIRSARKFTDGIGIRAEIQDLIVKRLQKHDVTLLSKAEKEKNTHISGRNLDPGEKEQVKQLIRQKKHIRNVLLQQCLDLGYSC